MSQPRAVAVFSRSFSADTVLTELLRSRVERVTLNETGRTLAGDELTAFAAGHDAVIVALEKVDDALLAGMPDVRIISKYGVGIDNVDLQACSQRSIAVGWTGGVNKRSVSELALGFMIGLLRNLNTAREEVRSGSWKQTRGRQLSSLVVGIVGCGHAGQDLARMLRFMGSTVLVHDLRDLSDFCRETGAEQVDLDTLVARSDVFSLHLPLTPRTRGIISRDRLAAMKPGSILVNTARGGLIDEAAAADALDSGQLAGAAFDVFEMEPPGDNVLIRHPKVLVSPHVGGSTNECVLAMGQAAIEGLFNAGDPLKLVPDYLKSDAR